jgi:hypothetical protein
MKELLIITAIAICLGACGEVEDDAALLPPPPLPIPEPVIPEPGECDDIFIPEDVSFYYKTSVSDIEEWPEPRPLNFSERLWRDEMLHCFLLRQVITKRERDCLLQQEVRVVEVIGTAPHKILQGERGITCKGNPDPEDRHVNTACARKDLDGNSIIVVESGRLNTNGEGVIKHELHHTEIGYKLFQQAGHYEPIFILDQIIEFDIGSKKDWDGVCSLNAQGQLTRQLIDIYLEDG